MTTIDLSGVPKGWFLACLKDDRLPNSLGGWEKCFTQWSVVLKRCHDGETKTAIHREPQAALDQAIRFAEIIEEQP